MGKLRLSDLIPGVAVLVAGIGVMFLLFID